MRVVRLPTDKEILRRIRECKRIQTDEGITLTFDIVVDEQANPSRLLRLIEFPLKGQSRHERIEPGVVVEHKASGDKGVVIELSEFGHIHTRWFDGKYDKCHITRFTSGELEVTWPGMYGGDSKLHG